MNPTYRLITKLAALYLCSGMLFAQEIDDSAIEARAAAAINASDTLDETAITVDSVNAYVLLTGQVLSPEQKQEASKVVAFATKNLRRLINETQVVTTLDSSFADSDAELLQRIEDKLEYMARNTEVVVFNGVVHLLGRVSREEGDAAAKAVSLLPGVKTIRLSYEYTD